MCGKLQVLQTMLHTASSQVHVYYVQTINLIFVVSSFCQDLTIPAFSWAQALLRSPLKSPNYHCTSTAAVLVVVLGMVCLVKLKYVL